MSKARFDSGAYDQWVVFSGYRFVLRAAERGQPVAIVNLGETRGDRLAEVRVDGRAGEILPLVVAAVVGA